MAWSGDPANYTDETYARACVLDRGPDAGPPKQRYGLPVRDPGGALNCDGVTAAQRMIGKVTGATPEQLASAKAKLEKLAAQCSSETRSAPVITQVIRPEPGAVEERSLPELTVDAEARKLRGRIPYNAESRDLGGWREIIHAGALNGADLGDLVVTVDHAGVPLGRHPRTLDVEDRDDGLHWSCEPPRSRADVLEAVERGDLRDTSWRWSSRPTTGRATSATWTKSARSRT